MVRTIIAARESRIFDKVWVSTEDSEIAEVALSAKAEVHHRPLTLAGDLISSAEVCLEFEKKMAKQGKIYDAVVCLQPSSPLRSATDIRDSWDKMLDSDLDFLVSITSIDPHYFHWAVHQVAGEWKMVFEDKFMQERSLLPPVYRPNGAIKIAKTLCLRNQKNFFGPKLGVYLMPEVRSIHIAESSDLAVAESLLPIANHEMKEDS